MTAYINGRADYLIAADKLTAAVTRNSEITEEQNRKMAFYTRWLLVLTLAMTLLVAGQIVITVLLLP